MMDFWSKLGHFGYYVMGLCILIYFSFSQLPLILLWKVCAAPLLPGGNESPGSPLIPKGATLLVTAGWE